MAATENFTKYLSHVLSNYLEIEYLLVDCVWSSFGNWSECSKSCGGGEKISLRTILQQPLFGGKHCEGEDKKSEICNDIACPGELIVIIEF